MTLDALEELEEAAEQLKAVAEMMTRFAYEGYSSGQGAVAVMSGQKHGMVGGGLSVKDARLHRELGQLRDEVGRKAMELKGIAGKYYRTIYEKSPGEPVTQEMLDNLEEWERDRERKRKGKKR